MKTITEKGHRAGAAHSQFDLGAIGAGNIEIKITRMGR